ncbi:MAG TPA: hypothetical protein VFJ48_00835 [Casimicrobiaceae bacterium]|nr:hypothetical protein [Casimicrobiaceae bacterium]
MDSGLLSLISACTALVASIAGPFVTLAVAKRNFNATVISANRQKWMELLRETLAELISLFVAALIVKAKWQRRAKDKWDHGRGALETEPGLIDKVQRMVLTQAKIRLLLNPNEADHQRLYQAIDSAGKRLQSEEAQEAETEADIEAITKLAQTILKREWLRVKHGT